MTHSTSFDWQQARSTLQQIWGYSDFRSSQAEIIQSLLTGQDALIVLPTGGGKSICFQLPALMRPGLTLVVSPLVALMENQVQELRQRRLPAALLHSELSSNERRQIFSAIDQQKLRLLYLSPETLLSPPVWERLSQPHLVIHSLILDEAHCLSQWGDGFRPAYRRLGTVRPALLHQKPPGTRLSIAAFTATADPQVQETIAQVLQLTQPQKFLQSPYRSNLSLAVKIAWSPRDRRQQILRFIRQRVPLQGNGKQAGTGLIYARSRHDAEDLARWLTTQGYLTAAYHAGLSAPERRSIEQDWISDRMPFVVCTSAFGMGVNKPNVRWVIHFQSPMLLSEYIQEVGRAGRDGKPSEALTFISEPTGWLDPTDRQRQQFFQAQFRKQQQLAQTLIRQIPAQGNLIEVSRQFKQSEIALALLHRTGQLEWQDPFHYVIRSPHKSIPFSLQQARQATEHSAEPMRQYLTTKACRWQFLLRAFGFPTEADRLKENRKGCGHCDRCT
ncbi:ATP-dependent DNA helicase RecQ [Leptolyngbya sp. FACHB-711]|uniref:RecQ family ATP-dependent DNA helicase n=1 Tax=unclassified Leptolyngbya TaxID=2650499 RepID=UPI0016897CF2|nr:ATP-dependent DNA helicase RecQ [Leptolyngbya sp. FACHB-711]MBD1848619.1 ATP-dependent DNA helicase RecQ [Cyanobacteria bacterium FACHB-502]MBD2026472.1 ATP-dependent DNA helicase RecQ [Leptolyngbya sp. FACHB-711]